MLPPNAPIYVSVFKHKVLLQPIFSIGHSNVTSPQIARLTKATNKMMRRRNKFPKKTKLTQANWSNQSFLCPHQKRMSMKLQSLLTIPVTILPGILLQESMYSKSLYLILVRLKSGSYLRT